MFHSANRDDCDNRIIRITLLCIVAVSVALLTACPLEFEDLEEPTILNLTISPSTVSQGDIGSQDFSAEISTANFDDELDPDRARVFISEQGQEGREAVASSVELIDDTIIVLDDIDGNWFAGEYSEPGDYDIGAEVASGTESARAMTLTVVTVTD